MIATVSGRLKFVFKHYIFFQTMAPAALLQYFQRLTPGSETTDMNLVHAPPASPSVHDSVVVYQSQDRAESKGMTCNTRVSQ